MILEQFQEYGPYAEPMELRKAGVSDVDTMAAIVSLCFGQSEEGTRKFISESMQRPQTEY